jgi:hypothetical protein
MAIGHARAKQTVRELLAAVKQLSPVQLRQFEREFTAWREQNGGGDAAALDEESLLAAICANSSLPAAQQQRFNRLRRKRQAETLSPSEAKELQALWQQVEQRNVARLEALTELARRRGSDVKSLMRELRLSENRDVF